MWKGSISVARAGCSLRRGWPSHQGGVRIRFRCGWPSNVMPNMSQTSRSYQSALGQRSVMVRTEGIRSLEGHLDAHVLVLVQGAQVVHDAEIGGGLAFAVRPCALVDGREVQEHGAGAALRALQPLQGLAEPRRAHPRRLHLVACAPAR